MSFRRFVYLMTNDSKWRDFPLYRIDMSRLFFPRGTQVSDPPLPKEYSLPSPDLRFRPPVSEYFNGSMGFVLFGGGENQSHQVVATDQTGRAVLCDPNMRSVRTLPSLVAPKKKPVSFCVGNNIYILDTVLNFTTSGSCYHCFDGLIFGADGSTRSHDDWYCHGLPPPPYVHHYNNHPYASPSASAHVRSHALVGGSNIWISKKTVGTHSFDVANSVWTKVGGWALPFSGRAHYLPEHKLWFGLSSNCLDGDALGDDALLRASDLTVAPPTAIDLWKDQTPADWISRSSYLLHLGCSKFCLARFFEIKLGPPDDLRSLMYVVFSGLEVERQGEELQVVKHMSEKYCLFHKLMHWVL